jgi:hypothetical protein
MSAEDTTLQAAVQSWQQRHGIADDDPLLAAGELFQIHIESLPKSSKLNAADIPSFTEFRERLEQLDTISKKFSNVGQDLIHEIRRTSPGGKTRPGMGVFLTVFSGMMGFGGGVYFSQFFPLS